MSQEIQEQLHKQQEVIADKQMSVKEDLDKVEPAVIEAQNGRSLLSGVRLSRKGAFRPRCCAARGLRRGFRQRPVRVQKHYRQTSEGFPKH